MSVFNHRCHFMQWKIITEPKPYVFESVWCLIYGILFFFGRSKEDPPSLSNITSLYGYYDDAVPLHWAVVDDGEIAFYSFENISFPTQIFMG